MTAVSKALVVGGGIGGLTAGIAFRRQGIAVDLVEIQSSWTVYGVGIIQPNNTLRSLDRIGLAQACVEHGAAFPGWRIHDGDGALLMEAPSTSTAAPAYPPVNGITRSTLHNILMEAAAASGVAARLGVTIGDLRQTDTGVVVEFTDGTTGKYDLVVGADGIHSDVRKRLFGPEHGPRFTGQGVWRYNLPRPADMEWGGLYFGTDSKAGLVPLSSSLMYIFLVTAEAETAWFPPDELAERLRDRLAGYGGLVARMRPLITDASSVVYRPMFNVMLPPPWMQGRVVVIGDAAHATTPHLAQGAAMAVEDAVLLAELVGTGGDLPGQLETFMARRYSRAKFVVDTSSQLAAWELEQWRGIHNPDADPGGLLHRATLALMDDY